MGGDSEPVEGFSAVHMGISPLKPRKTLVPSPSKTPNWKGKEKMVDGDEKAEENPSCFCGICLSEDGKATRGIIDCCDHYFCFVCIMEWAKVESRCPMCKQRFATIWRPPNPGSSLQERLVNIPVRDQVVGAGNVDPYANIYCTVCHGSDDDSVMLLCDLCDSSAHTYCVGLGATVPEGDWYCHDCTISRNELATTDANCESYMLNSPTKVEGVDVAQEHVLISEIVQDEPINHMPCNLSIQHAERSSGKTRRKITVKRSQDTSQHRTPHAPPPLVTVETVSSFPRLQITDQGAKTLSQCRNLQNCIRNLRENWNALQTGSLSFSSRWSDSPPATNLKRRKMQALNSCSGNSKDMNAASVNDEGSGEVSSSVETPSRNVYDVDRAWKMMEIAKSIQTSPQGKNTKGSLSEGTKIKLSDCIVTTNKRKTVENGIHAVERHANNSLNEGSVSVRCKLNKNGYVNKGVEVPVCSYAPVSGCASSSTPSAVKLVGSARDVSKDPDPRLHDPRLPNVHNIDVDLSSGSTLPIGSNISSNESNPKLSSDRKTELCKQDPGANHVEDGSAVEKYETCKSHIQALVKLNLKLLTKERQLAADRFKEVARIATHTILAACGLEHSKSIAHPFTKLHCIHAGKLQASSSLMPDCCRECFSIFTQDVVSTILSEKRDSKWHERNTYVHAQES